MYTFYHSYSSRLHTTRSGLDRAPILKPFWQSRWYKDLIITVNIRFAGNYHIISIKAFLYRSYLVSFVFFFFLIISCDLKCQKHVTNQYTKRVQFFKMFAYFISKCKQVSSSFPFLKAKLITDIYLWFFLFLFDYFVNWWE